MNSQMVCQCYPGLELILLNLLLLNIKINKLNLNQTRKSKLVSNLIYLYRGINNNNHLGDPVELYGI